MPESAPRRKKLRRLRRKSGLKADRDNTAAKTQADATGDDAAGDDDPNLKAENPAHMSVEHPTPKL